MWCSFNWHFWVLDKTSNSNETSSVLETEWILKINKFWVLLNISTEDLWRWRELTLFSAFNFAVCVSCFLRTQYLTSSLSSLLSAPLGGAVCGCRVLGAGRPGEDGPGATAHRKNTERDIRELLIEMFEEADGGDVHLSYDPQNTEHSWIVPNP